MTLAGWRFAAAQPIAAAVVWGGVEGWAMDFAAMGEALAARGIVAYLIDGPGRARRVSLMASISAPTGRSTGARSSIRWKPIRGACPWSWWATAWADA